jgi:hypothetical protein
MRGWSALDTRSAEAWRAGNTMTGECMSTDNPSSVTIQTEASPISSVPEWFGEVALLAHTVTRLGLLSDISERVRFTCKRFGTFARD